nr:MAG TPA: hypothetical protein [Caudoviricetes sp.]
MKTQIRSELGDPITVTADTLSVMSLKRLSEKTGRSEEELQEIIIARGIYLGTHWSSIYPFAIDFRYVTNGEGRNLILDLMEED